MESQTSVSHLSLVCYKRSGTVLKSVVLIFLFMSFSLQLEQKGKLQRLIAKDVSMSILIPLILLHVQYPFGGEAADEQMAFITIFLSCSS